MDNKDKVETGYDRIAEEYLKTKRPGDPVILELLEEAARGLRDGARALDLGCGAGVPVTQWLARRFEVTGVDVSERQLELARQHVPAAHLIKADIAGVDFPDCSLDIVVAFYSIIHVPRTEQPALVDRIYRWLRPGGRFLAPWTIGEWEGEEENWEGWGSPMWWSHYNADQNLAMLRDAGFHIVSAERRTSGAETWLWVLAHKQSA
jgi:SAM-dependent methyltransferase